MLDVPLLSGRDFRSSDTLQAPLVAIINQSMAKYWDGRDPVGTQFTIPVRQPPAPVYTVIGVVADFRTGFLDAAAKVLGRDAIRRPASFMPDVDGVSAADSKRVWKDVDCIEES